MQGSDHQMKFLRIEHILIKLGGQKYYQSASGVQNLVYKYVSPDMRDEFIEDLIVLLKNK